MMKRALRVGFALGRYAPFRIPCAQRELGQDPTPYDLLYNCPFPGLYREILFAVARTLNYTIIPDFEQPTDLTTSLQRLGITYDVYGELHATVRALKENFTASTPVVFQGLAALTSSKPINFNKELLSYLHPFEWNVWLLLAGIILLNRLFSLAFRGNILREIKRNRPSYTASLLPVTLGVMLCNGLYRSGLLANLLVSRPRYLIEDHADIPYIPKDIVIYASPSKWRHVIETIPHVKEQVVETLMDRNTPFEGESVNPQMLREISTGQAIYIGYESAVDYQINACNHKGLRKVPLQAFRPVNFIFNTAASDRQRQLLEEFNPTIHDLYGLIETLEERYSSYLPGTVHCASFNDAEPVNFLDERLSLRTVRGVFYVLFAGVGFSALVLMVEQCMKFM